MAYGSDQRSGAAAGDRSRRAARAAGVPGALAVLLMAASLPGCGRATVLNPSPNDVLREENLRLREQVERLSLQVKELETRATEQRGGATSAPARSPTADPEVDAATPRVASVVIEGATEAVRPPGDAGSAATLRLWILPRDGRGRFLQVVGRLSVSVVCLRAGSPPIDIARASFTPAQVRDAWRSGWMGSHYAFEIPLDVPPEAAGSPLTVSIRFDDALSGASFADERRIAAPRPAPTTMSGSSAR